jgi:transposase
MCRREASSLKPSDTALITGAACAVISTMAASRSIPILPAHKAAGVREAVEARGATLRYLPKYSPDLNPIEMSFSRLKAYLRKAGERTIPRLRRRLGWFARNVTPREAANYFTHAGYA